MRILKTTPIFPLLLLLLPTLATAGPPVALVGQAGTLGVGAVIYLGFPHSVDLRFGSNVFLIRRAVDSGSTQYRARMRLESFTLLGDWHPFRGVFRFTAGVIDNQNRFFLRATPRGGTYTISGTTYTYAAPQAGGGSLVGTVTFAPVAPYVGIGFGNPFRGGHWTVGLDLGVVYQGAPKVSLSATTLWMAANVPTAQESLHKTFDALRWYPVVMFSGGYRF